MMRIWIIAILLCVTPALADSIDTEIDTVLRSGQAPPISATQLRGVLHDMNAHTSTIAVPYYNCPLCGGGVPGRVIGTDITAVPEWLSTYAYGIDKTPIIVESTVGEVAITGASRSSDTGAGGGTIGLMGWGMADSDTHVTAVSGAYVEARRYTSLGGGGLGIESDATDFSTGGSHKTQFAYNPYTAGAVASVWVASGGNCTASAPCFNPTTSLTTLASSPASTGVGIVANGSSFDKGIFIGYNALTNMDGNTGTGVAMEMPKGAAIQWMYCPNTASYPANCGNGTEGAEIQSSVTSNTTATRIVFTNSAFTVGPLAGGTAALSVTSAGQVTANTGFTAGASAGLSVTKTVRAAGGASDCTLIFTGGLLTGGSC